MPNPTPIVGARLMKLKHKMALMCYGPFGEGKPEILDAGELVMPVGEAKGGCIDVMTIAGLARVRVDGLEDD